MSVRPEDPPVVHDAQTILGYLHKLQGLRGEDSIPDLALDHALRIGFWFAVSSTRGEKELFALRGKESAKKSKEGTQILKQKTEAETNRQIAVAQEIIAKPPTLSCQSVAELVKKRTKTHQSVRTIRYHISHLFKNTDSRG